MTKAFTFDINLTAVLSEREIWPDGNAPPNPTLADVERLFFMNANVHATCQAWGLEITKGDVTITDDMENLLEARDSANRSER